MFAESGMRPGGLDIQLSELMRDRFGITVVIDAELSETTKRLRVARWLMPGQRAFQIATQLSAESRGVARVGLANYFAGAFLLPYREFHQAAAELRYDIDLLGSRFGVGFETVCHRLSTLQRPQQRGVPFIIVRTDKAGNISKRRGMGAIYGPLAAALGDGLHLSQPVRQITQDADGVTVRANDLTVRVRRVIVAIPLAIASSIDYEPTLPLDRAFLHQRMPGGAIFKISVVYDEPFWRGDGLSGRSAAPGSPATLTIDACTDTGDPGVMCVITEGPAARRLGRLDESERKAEVIGELVDRFGSNARAPLEFHEQNWTVERYSGGGMISHAPTGVLTQFGYTLREPCGRVHWAGTESSAIMCGWVDGAIRSGERAAAEVMSHEAESVA